MGALKKYPEDPGFKGTDTSEEAAESMIGRADLLRNRCFNIIYDRGAIGATADECAKALGESVLAIRPRISELKRNRRIEDSGMRRANTSGRRAAVMVVVE